MRASCSGGWFNTHPHPDGSAELAATSHTARYATPEVRDPESEQALMDVIDEFELLACMRSWSAWGYGTMTEDDFEPAPSEDLVEAIVAAGWRPPSKVATTVPSSPSCSWRHPADDDERPQVKGRKNCGRSLFESISWRARRRRTHTGRRLSLSGSILRWRTSRVWR